MLGGTMMTTTERVGVLRFTAAARIVRQTVTRMMVSIGATALVVTAAAPLPEVELAEDSTVLLLCGVTCPTWLPDDVDRIMDQFVTPTHPSEPGDIVTKVPVTAPGELWPITGLGRLLLLALADPRLAGFGGGAWPDVPLWKLSGLFDLTANQSVQAGATALEEAMAANPSDHQVIYGYSQGAGVANVVKGRLAAQYSGPTAPDIDFVLGGDPNLPNGGLMSRFPGLYIPILDFGFNGPAKTDTEFDTVEINGQYDGFVDFPLYPLNLLATVNAIFGIAYVHGWPFDPSLPADPTTSPAYQGIHGDTSYYFFETQDLPLFGPLRNLGVPESLIDVVEPFFRVLVELGYDRSIPAWKPTPARLIPRFDPATVARDLIYAIGEGINNALAVVGLPPLLHIPAPAAAPEIEPPQSMSTATPTVTRQMTTAATTTTIAITTAVDGGKPEAFEEDAPDEVNTDTDRPTTANLETEKAAPIEPSPDPTPEPTQTPEPEERDALEEDSEVADRPEPDDTDEPSTEASVDSEPGGSETAGNEGSDGDADAGDSGTDSTGTET
jgi:PE-PPE domain